MSNTFRIGIVFLIIFVLLAIFFFNTTWAAKLSEDSASFIFKDPKGNHDKPITVWYYRPSDLKPNTPAVFVMHGLKRNGKQYRDSWIKYAKNGQFLLLVPEFSKEYYPSSRKYNLGNMFTKSGKPVDESQWTFTAIERIFDHVKTLNSLIVDGYYMYGHSAGAQFVHRLVTFKPNARVKLAIAANAGWYTMPNFNVEFPYGLANSSINETILNIALGKKLIILLGTEDNDPNHKYLRKTPEAMAQGRHRFERGKTFYEAGRIKAMTNGVNFGWELKKVWGVGHSNSKMSIDAAKIIAGY